MALEWYKISETEAFLGRTGDCKDEIGSRLIASQLIHCLMNLCFLMERQYAPYSKWFGTFFKKLNASSKLLPLFEKATQTTDWKTREKYITKACEIVAQGHNDLKITKPLSAKIVRFHRRPYLVINAALFADEISKKIKNKELRALKPDVGLVLKTISETEELQNISKLIKRLS